MRRVLRRIVPVFLLLAFSLLLFAPSASAAAVAPAPAAPPAVCADPGIGSIFTPVPGAGCAIAGGADTVANAIDFAKDPFLYVAKKIAVGATSLLAAVTKWAVESTSPDYSLDWWRATYAKCFALSLVMFGFILVTQLAKIKQRGEGGDSVTSLGGWVVAFFLGATFGPAIGAILIHGFSLLSTGIISHWASHTPAEAMTSVTKAVEDAAGGKGLGDIIGAIILLIGVIISCFFLVLSLILQMMIVYFSGAFFALGWVWIISPTHRAGAIKWPLTIVALLAAKPLMFLALGMSIDAIESTALNPIGDTGKNFALVMMSAILFMLIAFMPLGVLKLVGKAIPGGTDHAQATGGRAKQQGQKGNSGKDGGNGSGSAGGQGMSATAKAAQRNAAQNGSSNSSGGQNPNAMPSGRGNVAAAAKNSNGATGTPGSTGATGTSGGSGPSGSSGVAGTGTGQGTVPASNGSAPAAGGATSAGGYPASQVGGPVTPAASKLAARAAAVRAHPAAAVAATTAKTVGGAVAGARRKTQHLSDQLSGGDQSW